MQVKEVLLVVSVFLLVILLAVTLSHCTLMGRRPPVNTTDAEAQTGDAKEEKKGGL